MRTFYSLSLCLLPAVASVLLGPAAHADTDPLFCQGGNAAAAMHDDMDTPPGAGGYPETHWSARIGSGVAAQPENPGETFSDDTRTDATSVRRPGVHWTSRIGTGTVANEPPVD